MQSIPNSISSFEPTYKELKPLKAIQSDPSHLSFEPTYKELKHDEEGSSKDGDRSVLSLPIRN